MQLMLRGIRRPGWLFTLILVATPYLGIWLFLLFIVRPSEQPWLTAAVVWLLCVKAAFVLIIARHLKTPEAVRPQSPPPPQITVIAVGFLVAAVLFGCSALGGEGIVSIVGLLYLFPGVVVLLMAQAAKTRPSNPTAGDGVDEPAHKNHQASWPRRA
jgi:hypothetical protein